VKEPPRPRSTGSARHAHRVTPMYLALLNSFELRDLDHVVSLPQSAERMLAFLAISGGPVDRLHVAGTLWPDVDEARATACLRSTLWRIRQAGRSAVEANGARIRLGSSVVTDLHELTRSLRKLRERDLTDHDVVRVLAPAELLPGWYEDWVLVERERVRQLRLHALEQVCVRLVEERRFAEAVEAGLAAVHSDPLRETAQRALIGVYLAEGNGSEAVRAYRRFRQLLNDQLGLNPSADLERLLHPLTGAGGHRR
jgi:DNA-binding SARP family transcriptional activator